MFNIIIYFINSILHTQCMDRGHNKLQDLTQRSEGILYCRSIKQFLECYKTKKCNINAEHNEQICTHYHSKEDKRRNPYTNHTFLYYPNKLCNCDKEKCPNIHNKFEQIFHPLLYKTHKCNNYYDCMFYLQCCGVHAIDDKHFQQGQYFRFDIELFKTKPCMRKDQHERKVCNYYHNDKDKRRPNFDTYNHIPCTKSNCNCQKSHNKIQQLYHPSRYKSKFCQTFGKDSFMCDYRDFCSFSHTKQQITIQLMDPNNEEPNYIVNWYKTVWCPYTHDHDRSSCNYAHNIQDLRRRPKDYKYLPEKCQAWIFSSKIESIQQAGCKAGMKCNKCHGWMEQRYHPQIYLKKNKHYIQKQQALQKKLIHQRDNSKNPKQKNIQTIANKEIESKIQSSNKNSKFSVGAPFFKSQRDISQTSKATKAKSGNIGSDKSCNQSDQRGKLINQNSQKNKKITNSVYFEDQIWNFSHQNEIQQQKNQKEQTRSKSQGNTEDYEQSYSRSIKDVFIGDNSLLDKLNKNRVHQIILISMDDRKINDMNFLNKGQKEKLLLKLKEYSLKKAIRFVEYSKKLTLFFIKNQADDILQKLREKKIKEQKILKLNTAQSTKDFEFLSQEERQTLPKLMKSYNNDIQFGSLIKDVEQYVVQPNYYNDFNNDN